MKTPRQWWSALPSRRGFVFDVGTFVAGLLSYELTRRFILTQPGAGKKIWGAEEIMANRPLVWLMRAGWVSFILGVSLKRNGLHLRAAQKAAPYPADPWLLGGGGMVLSLILTFLLLLMPAMWTGLASGYWSIPVLLLPPLALLRAVRRPASLKPPLPAILPSESVWIEHLADLLLFISLVPLQILLRQFCSELTPGNWVGYAALIGFFYMVPRIIYLLEDAADWRTWLRMVAVMAPMLLRT